MNILPIEIENEILTLYYSHIYYTNVISVLNKRKAICNEIKECYNVLTTECNSVSTELILLLKCYNNELSNIYENDELERRLFQISFYNF